MAYSVADIADLLQLELVGDGSAEIDRIEPLQSARRGSLSFLSHGKFKRFLSETQASVVILGADMAPFSPVAALIAKNPYLSYAKAARLLYPAVQRAGGIHPSAVVDPAAQVDPSARVAAQVVIEAGAVIGAGSQLGAGCYIGAGVHLGDDCRLSPNVTINQGCYLGSRVVIQPGAVIGSEGFGYANEQGRWLHIPQIGGVQIGDDVEIGANTTIDRGALEDTVIEEGVILDNLIQVAHNVHIGAFTAIAGCVGIAGSARIGRYCTIGGAAGVLGHLEICDHVHITAKSLVTKSISEPGSYSSGTPLQESRSWRKNAVRFGQLDTLARRLSALEK